MHFSQAMWLAIVEGLTEYLPISSTGHLIMTSWTMGIQDNPFVKDYTVMVQFGAIFAVVVLYWRKFILNVKMYPAVAIAVLPAVVIGLALKKKIDVLLGSIWVVAIAFLIGGIFLVLTDAWVKRQKHRIDSVEKMPWPVALKVGFFQCFAFIPGVSRSAASILGALEQGLEMNLAVEFSFFLAVPTLTGATLLKAMKVWPTITHDQISILVWGNVVSFIVGLIAIRGFVKVVSRYGLKGFGWYRIVLGLVLIVLLLRGHNIGTI